MAYFPDGHEGGLDALLVDGATLSVTVFIVQPGVGRRLKRAHSNLLAAANAYLVGGQLAPLKVIGSVAKAVPEDEDDGEA